MDNRQDVREFLISRRARVSPQQAGLPAGPNRRVAGLRRSEVAALAGVSVEYYAKLERGHLAGVSPGVLNAVARALRLDHAERTHLVDLARAADGTSAITQPRRHLSRQWRTRPSLQWALDGFTTGPAFVRNGRLDLLAANRAACALYDGVYQDGGHPPNFARYTFLDRGAQDLYPDWGSVADICVAILRTATGRDPHDRELHDLVGELSHRSAEFRTRWDAHDVRDHGTGVKSFRHRVVGDITVAYECLEMPADRGLTMTVYTAEPGSASAGALLTLASCAAGNDDSALRPASDGR